MDTLRNVLERFTSYVADIPSGRLFLVPFVSGILILAIEFFLPKGMTRILDMTTAGRITAVFVPFFLLGCAGLVLALRDDSSYWRARGWMLLVSAWFLALLIPLLDAWRFWEHFFAR